MKAVIALCIRKKTETGRQQGAHPVLHGGVTNLTLLVVVTQVTGLRLMSHLMYIWQQDSLALV